MNFTLSNFYFCQIHCFHILILPNLIASKLKFSEIQALSKLEFGCYLQVGSFQIYIFQKSYASKFHLYEILQYQNLLIQNKNRHYIDYDLLLTLQVYNYIYNTYSYSLYHSIIKILPVIYVILQTIVSSFSLQGTNFFIENKK